MQPVSVKIVTYAPTAFRHCQHCELAFEGMGMGEIGETFDGDVRAVVPLLDSDIRGVAALQEAGRRLFS